MLDFSWYVIKWIIGLVLLYNNNINVLFLKGVVCINLVYLIMLFEIIIIGV